MFQFKNRRSVLLFGLVVLLTSKKTYYSIGGIAAIAGTSAYIGYKFGYDNAKPAEVRQITDTNNNGLEYLIIKDRVGRERFFVKKPNSDEYEKIKHDLLQNK